MSFDDSKYEPQREQQYADCDDADQGPLSSEARHVQRPLDDFEIRRTPGGGFEVVYCGSRFDRCAG